MKRSSVRSVGLLDLPTELLLHIFSLLGTLSRAAVRLTCRALHRSAPHGQSHVTFKMTGKYTARALASPRVLALAHSFESLLARLNDGGHKNTGEEEARGLGHLGNHRTPAWLRAEFLAGIAREVETFNIADGWKLAADQEAAVAKNQLLFEPQVLLSAMSQLTSLRVGRPLDAATLHELVSLPYLACLELTTLHDSVTPTYVIQQLCSMTTLTRLDLGKNGLAKARDGECTRKFNFRLMLEMIASAEPAGRAEGLQHLTLPLATLLSEEEEDAQDLSMLDSLTALTALHVRALETPDLQGVACLTSLKALEVAVLGDQDAAADVAATEVDQSASTTLTPLTALHCLTRLELCDIEYSGWMCGTTYVPWDFSGLSHLTALKVLRCPLYQEAQFVEGDLLPVQLRFLRTAPALEELALGFNELFWTLSRESSSAIHQAVTSLVSLKRVTVRIHEMYASEGVAFPDCFVPLAVFACAAAASLETLTFEEGSTWTHENLPSATFNCLLDGFTRLKKLRSLVLEIFDGVPTLYTELLSQLSPTQLTCLSLAFKTASPALMEEVARFRDLQELQLYFPSGA